ncbi:TIGR03767 family metallophosphoesterase [Kitasatospora sp. NBC_00240]|uniref:TIGR03767 family metallophosphoesterase n=1 Tax=Kitasatospora sp. NBC_00240 TaxID=2903567 RepID=UPI00225842A3|nr:TIGR03767 family metallophosphoesterase [Kitasatospora sp. NBC_00240]MCX5208354.1 TIGR03767 family metallophosphoesterase [Kitasatospora sp. NBC_00240]
MGGSHHTTLHRTIGRGRVLRKGTVGPYRELEFQDGEPHVIRDDLLGEGRRRPPVGDRRTLLCIGHVTDFQIGDVQSPARFEFFNREGDDPRFAALLPVQRPQEALTAHAVDAVVRTLNGLDGSPVTGAPLSLVVTTGDVIDNAQWNEMQMFLALLEGGRVRPDSGGPGYQGVQSRDWPDRIYWQPEGDGTHGPDLWCEWYGFPHHPGLLRAATAEFDAPGLELPWLACFGNHEALTQGVGALTRSVLEYLVGGRKPVDLPPGVERDHALDLFTEHPEAFLSGHQLPVTPDVERRGITRAEFVAEHFRTGGRPYGHGFTRDNLREGTAYYTYDDPESGVRMIALDTNCLAGGADGCLDAEQGRWLEQRLIEAHSRYRRADGDEARTPHEDHPVIILSHHGPDTLVNRRGLAGDSSGPLPLVEPQALLALLHRFPNVVLWLNGHRHFNMVRPRPDPTGFGHGFWEVTTCAVMDWPCQARLVELVDNRDGALSVLCTMVDHDTPARPDPADGRTWLPSLHREIAANVPWGVPLAGTPGDRNVDLLLPFPGTKGRSARNDS